MRLSIGVHGGSKEQDLPYDRMLRNVDDRTAIDALDSRLKLLLPEEYRDSYEAMQPKPMGSAPLKYDTEGQVAWDQIWGSFCDLAMAGGPPHKGRLLGPGLQSEIDAQFNRYDEVAEEICRGIRLATGLRSYVSPTVGWVCVTCLSDAMAEWLVRAIVMENVAELYRRESGQESRDAALKGQR